MAKSSAEASAEAVSRDEAADSIKQQSRAVARKPRDAAAVLFGLKFADSIHFKFKSSQASKLKSSQLQTYWRKTGFNAKWPFYVIHDHVFWSQWKDDKGLINTKY